MQTDADDTESPGSTGIPPQLNVQTAIGDNGDLRLDRLGLLGDRSVMTLTTLWTLKASSRPIRHPR